MPSPTTRHSALPQTPIPTLPVSDRPAFGSRQPLRADNGHQLHRTPPPLQSQFQQQNAPMMRTHSQPGTPFPTGVNVGTPPGMASPGMASPVMAAQSTLQGYMSPPGTSPLTQPQQLDSPWTSPPSSPTYSRAKQHKLHRKRIYAEQITHASQGQPESHIAYPGSPTGHHQTYPTHPNQSPGSPTTANGLPYPQSALTHELSGMHIYGPTPPQNVSLFGIPPPIARLGVPPPHIQLPPNVALTDSPTANCDPAYKSSTIQAVPFSDTLLKQSRLPFALVLAPFRTINQHEAPVPVIRDAVITRCRRCRTYINPFVTFVEGDTRWRCNMCSYTNNVPAAFGNAIETERPVGRWKRIELNHGCVEFVAPKEYMVRPLQAPAFVFVIDVSFAAVQSGMVAAVARIILEALDNLPNKENRTSIGFITVDSALHFYNLNPSLTGPQMIVVNDLDEIYLPLPRHLLVNLTESKHVVRAFLQKLPFLFHGTSIVDNALGSALQAAYKMMSGQGGKIICLQATLPNVGIGALHNREDPKLRGTAKETQLLNIASPFFKSFSIDCSQAQIGCDMLLFGDAYKDCATLNCLPRYTGGQTYMYPDFHASNTEDVAKLTHEFSNLLAEEIGLEAVLRIRASRGLRMSVYHGNFFVRSSDLLALPNVPRNQSYCVEVEMEDDMKTSTACFQTALLHTTCDGERRIRVITLCLPVVQTIPELYTSVNQHALLAYLANKAIERGLASKLEDARDTIISKIVDLLGVYKIHVLDIPKGSTPPLSAPSHLSLLPLLGLTLIKHDALRLTNQLPVDQRSNAIHLQRTMPLELLVPYLHPNLYALHHFGPEEDGTFDNDVQRPQALHLTIQLLQAHGCYLLENGQEIYIWVGRNISPLLCMDLFNVRTYAELSIGKTTLPTLETFVNKRTRNLIATIRNMRHGNYYPAVQVVKQDCAPALKAIFQSRLIEDCIESTMSYAQFLQHLQSKVNNGSF